jgi:thiamine-phosphate pyrophosphorylase
VIKLDRFYLIVDSAAWIERLAPAGIRLVQLRIKDQSIKTVQQEITAAWRFCKHAGITLVINDHWQFAIDTGCDFVHLGQSDLEQADIPALRRAGIQLGISTHDHAELNHALTFDPDYVALGPIYPTVLKQMPWAPQGLKRITEWRRLVGARPLVAIGGLTVERLPGVLAAGADSAAVVTDVLRHADPEGRTLEWLRVTHE